MCILFRLFLSFRNLRKMLMIISPQLWVTPVIFILGQIAPTITPVIVIAGQIASTITVNLHQKNGQAIVLVHVMCKQ